MSSPEVTAGTCRSCGRDLVRVAGERTYHPAEVIDPSAPRCPELLPIPGTAHYSHDVADEAFIPARPARAIRVPSGTPGRCVECKRRRVVYRVARQGGGTYRRGGRSYYPSICGECADGYAEYLPERGSGHTSYSRWSLSHLRDVIENRDKSRDAERPKDWGYTP